MQDYAQRTVTFERHPHLDEMHASIHPCQVSPLGTYPCAQSATVRNGTLCGWDWDLSFVIPLLFNLQHAKVMSRIVENLRGGGNVPRIDQVGITHTRSPQKETYPLTQLRFMLLPPCAVPFHLPEVRAVGDSNHRVRLHDGDTGVS